MSSRRARASARVTSLALVVAACGSTPDGGATDECSRGSARFATSVVEHSFGEGRGTTLGQGEGEFPERVLGGPRGGGCCAGSTDVTTLGNGGWVVLAFEANAIVDGEGPDFLVAENPFWIGGDESRVFAELATVSVSDDGETFVEFPCDALGPPYGSCAGWRPVLANVESDGVDPFDATAAGGDPFDLADVGIARARFVRIEDRADLAADLDGAFDLDAVTILNGACP